MGFASVYLIFLILGKNNESVLMIKFRLLMVSATLKIPSEQMTISYKSGK